MHFRRLICFLLGLWIGGSLFMAFVATQNFRSVDRLLSAPEQRAGDLLEKLGPEASRHLFQHFVGEQNRFYFEAWEWAQIAVGLLVLLIMLLGSREGKTAIAITAVMLGIVLLFRFFLTPQIVELGRVLDFQPAGVPPAERRVFRDLHAAYSAAEVVKWLLGLVVLAILIIPRRKAGNYADNLEAIEQSSRRRRG